MEPVDRAETEQPPEHAEEWSDDQWLEWLKATDTDAPNESPTPTERIVHSQGGQALGNAMVGLSNAIFGPKEKPAVVEEANSDPEEDEPFTVHLVPDHPEQSSVVFNTPADDQPESPSTT